MVLASAGEWDKATEALEAGRKMAPHDKRFPIELAGLAYREKKFEQAKGLLRRALQIDSSDQYANQFLATLYFLDGNLEAAVKFWNRAGSPVLQSVTPNPQPQLDPSLLDRAFMFAPGTMLTVPKLLETQQRIELLHVFPNYRFEIVARQDGRFDVLFRNTERNGWGDSKVRKLISLFRQLPLQTITPEVFNLRHKGVNFVSLYRFDAQKRRVSASFSAPLKQDPKWRYGLDVDLRKETWDIRYPSALSFAARNVKLEKAEAGARIEAVVSPTWHWTSAVQLAGRRFVRSLADSTQTGADASFAADFLQNGTTLKYTTQLDGTPIHLPERRLVGTVNTDLEVGKWWTSNAQSFAKVQSGIRVQWMPQPRGDDYTLATQIRAGKTWGAVPLDELNTLGMGGDNDLWMRAHPVTHGGRKGGAPMGRRYLLWNSEWDKNLYHNGFMTLKVGPFFDAGRISDPSAALGSRQWLFDTGAQIKVRLFGSASFALIYGRDLRGGTQAFRAAALK